MAKLYTGQTQVRSCTCAHEAQDKMYGTRKRVHNYGDQSQSGRGGTRKRWCCTVCGKHTDVGDK